MSRTLKKAIFACKRCGCLKKYHRKQKDGKYGCYKCGITCRKSDFFEVEPKYPVVK